MLTAIEYEDSFYLHTHTHTLRHIISVIFRNNSEFFNFTHIYKTLKVV
jgi:hypothetical protein